MGGGNSVVVFPHPHCVSPRGRLMTGLHRRAPNQEPMSRASRPRVGQGRGRLRLGRTRPYALVQQGCRTRSLAERASGWRSFRTVQAIGSTDCARQARSKTGRSIFQKVIATQYHFLDVDPNQVTLPDLVGRPHSLIDQSGPINELRSEEANCYRFSRDRRVENWRAAVQGRIARTSSTRGSILIGLTIHNPVVRRDRSVLNKRNSYLAPGMGYGENDAISADLNRVAAGRRAFDIVLTAEGA